MKTRHILSIACCILLVTGFSSCGKKVDKGNTDFIGFWEGTDGTKTYIIDIGSDSKARHSECEGILNCSEWEGKARIKNDQLKVGVKKLDIGQEPAESGTDWTMTVEGIVYTKAE